MLPIVVLLCLASSQVLGSAIPHHNSDAHADAQDSANYAASKAHSDGAGKVEASSRKYEYAFDKEDRNAHSDGSVDRAQSNSHNGHNGFGHGYGFPGFFNGHSGHAAHGDNQAAHSEDYNNDYSHSHDRGMGSGSEDSYAASFNYNNDAADQNGEAASSSSQGYNHHQAAAPYFHGYGAPYGYPAYGRFPAHNWGSAAKHNIFKRYAPWNTYYRGYPAYRFAGHNWGSAAKHNLYKRNAPYNWADKVKPAYDWSSNNWSGNNWFGKVKPAFNWAGNNWSGDNWFGKVKPAFNWSGKVKPAFNWSPNWGQAAF